MIDPKIYREMGLNDGEYAQIVETLGREPTLTELGMYAVMWSEHCGYKYSRPVLRLFKKYQGGDGHRRGRERRRRGHRRQSSASS